MEEETNNSSCKDCDEVDAAQLIAEVEHLRRHLADRDTHIVTLEAKLQNGSSRINNLDEQLTTWKEKYERLYDSHKRVQKLNQVLEDKLLQMVDKMKSEKSQLTKDIATLSVRLAESKHNYSMLQKENERYKNDMNLATQLLQCKPDNFVSQKLDSLPVDTQTRVSQYVMSKTAKPLTPGPAKTINDNETFDASEYEFNISASLMSKILEDSIQDTVTKHCDTCTCTASQAKPFCYNESYYSTATQTLVCGEINNYYCSNCHMDVKSADSNTSIRSTSPVNKIADCNKKNNMVVGPMYAIPEPSNAELNLPCADEVDDIDQAIFQANATNNNICATEVVNEIKQEPAPRSIDCTKLKLSNVHQMETAVHHKLCDHTRASISSKKSSSQSIQEDTLVKETPKANEIISKSENHSLDNLSIRKNSLSSMGAVSRASSVAKSTVSTHKSNTHVGPGPRFCHLRMQAGSKNILLDNAEPDVPPVLYRRQSKCNENSIFKDLNDGLEEFINAEKITNDHKDDNKNENVVESTLIDVQIDNNNKETTGSEKSINPVLMNVSSSPLQPLKTHNFSKNTEQNNNIAKSVTSQQNNGDIDNLLTDFGADLKVDSETKEYSNLINTTPTDSHDIKIFNFDRYEQNKITNQLTRPLKKIDMSQLHTLENTKISKDPPPLDENTKIEMKAKPVNRPTLPSIVNVYPNLTQTQLKVNESKKVFTNEQSSSSLSSDDSAAFLQKQQLIRVAEWVEKNLEQHNNFNDPLEDEVAYNNNRSIRRGSKLSRAAEAATELVLNMPHPVSKFSKSYSRDPNNTRVHNSTTSQASNDEKSVKPSSLKISNTIIKETIFPVECGETTTMETTNGVEKSNFEVENRESDVLKEIKELRSGEKEITSEELARMEYNVKKFLLSGPYWVKPNNLARVRRTSSKTETDV